MKHDVRNLFFGSLTLWLACGLGSVWAKALTWPDTPDGRRYRIDITRAMLEWERTPNDWQAVGSVHLINVDERELPPNARAICLSPRDQRFRYLLIDCTGQVYRFDAQTHTLERLDKTFYRGFNCYSSRFLRHDTLYSFGGYGFWHTNNILTYYKPNAGEWESLVTTNAGPASLYRGVNGYLPESDVFFSALTYRESDSEQKGQVRYDSCVYAFHFPTWNWERLGTLSTAARTVLNFDFAKEASFVQAGRYFLIPRCGSNPVQRVFVVDALSNRLYEWEDTHKEINCWFFYGEDEHPYPYVWADTVHFYRNAKGTPGNRLEKQQMAVARLLREARYVGPFYEPVRKPIAIWYASALVGLVVGGFAGVWWWLRRPKPAPTQVREEPTQPDLSNLDGLERRMLQALLDAHEAGGLPSDRLNDALGLEGKNVENQRKIRADVINGLSTKLHLLTTQEAAVERRQDERDRRLVVYQLKAGVFAQLRNQTAAK